MMNSPTKFRQLSDMAAPLIEAGLPLPVPLRWALDGDPEPLALSTRATWPEWARAHGYNDDQVAALNACIGRITRSTSYIKALALDLSVRYDADGNVTEPTTDMDRRLAVETITARSVPKPKPAPAPEAQSKPPTPTPTPAPPPKSRETIKLKGTLSLPEIERRKAALAAAR
jgi:hypothetical protein